MNEMRCLSRSWIQNNYQRLPPDYLINFGRKVRGKVRIPSNALNASNVMKLINTGTYIATTFSMISLSVNICSQHDLPGLKPACSCLSFPSTAFLIRFSDITVMTFPGVDSRVMALQLMHSLRSSFRYRYDDSLFPIFWNLFLCIPCCTPSSVS